MAFYFIAYQTNKIDGSQGFGNVTIKFPIPLNEEEAHDLMVIANQFVNERKITEGEAVITNISRL